MEETRTPSRNPSWGVALAGGAGGPGVRGVHLGEYLSDHSRTQ